MLYCADEPSARTSDHGKDRAWENRVHIVIGDLEIGVIGREDFIANKTATGRPKDMLDLALLPPR